MFKKLIALGLALFSAACFAQSSPGFTYGQVPTPGQWNSYFAAKQDYIIPGNLGNVLQSNGSSWYSAPIASSLLPLGTSVNNPGTNTLESLLPPQTVTGTSYVFATADLFKKTRRSNSTVAMTDTLPASTAIGISNGTQINIVNVDASATDTVTAGAGTTISGNSSVVIQPGRDIWMTYDAANSTWRFVANTSAQVLFSGAPATANQLYAGSGVPGNATALTIAQLKVLTGEIPTVTDPAYGAKCDNSTDDTAAFTAIAAASPLFALPAGKTCVISSAITLSSTAGMGIIGDGEGSSIIRINSTTAEGIILPAGASNPLMYGFQITRTGTASAGATNLDVSGGTAAGRFERLVVTNGYVNIKLGPTDHGGLRDILVGYAVSHGILMVNSASSGSLQWQLDNVLSVQNGGTGVLVNAVNSGPSAITMGEWRSVQTFANTGYGIAFLGASAIPIEGIRLRDIFVGQDGAQEVYLDTYNNNGNTHIIEAPYIEAGGTSSTGPTLSTPATHTASGIYITANNGTVQINGATINNNSADGIDTSATSTIITSSIVTNNGSGSVTQRGIINLGTGRIIVSNSQVGNTTGITTQLYGIGILSGSDYNLITGNDLRGNATGAIFNTSTGTNNHIELNSGYNPSGTLLTSATALSGAITGTPSSTNYVRGDGTWSAINSVNGLNSATTVVNTSAAPAPSAGQVLTATSSTTADWATPLSGLSVINGYINGYTLSNDGTTPNTVLDVAAGYAADSTNTLMITGTAFTKSVAGTFTAGTGNNGMGTGLTVAASTWYHVFGIVCSGSYDVYFDTSLTAANKPACATQFRYVGSFKTNASVHILAFTQVGQKFIWAAPPPDLNNSSAGSGTITLSTPPGISVTAILTGGISGATNASCTISILSGINGASDGVITGVGTVFSGSGQITTTTNTSAQITFSAGNNGGATMNTVSYINPKVAPNN